jgi:hypothetical protein
VSTRLTLVAGAVVSAVLHWALLPLLLSLLLLLLLPACSSLQQDSVQV